MTYEQYLRAIRAVYRRGGLQSILTFGMMHSQSGEVMRVKWLRMALETMLAERTAEE